MKRALLLLSALLLTGCGLEGNAYTGDGVIYTFPLSFGDVAPLVLLCLLTLLLLMQAPLSAWYYARRAGRRLRFAAFSWSGFTTGLSLIPLCYALYLDTFHIRMAGPFNFGWAIFIVQLVTIPMMLAGFLLVGLITLGRWWWLRRRAS